MSHATQKALVTAAHAPEWVEDNGSGSSFSLCRTKRMAANAVIITNEVGSPNTK